jgi:ketosteroid isomerase-like protein
MKTTLPLLALTALLGACAGNANTPPAEATAPSTTMADTNVGEQFLEANVKEDSVKLRSLLADDVLVIGTSPKQRASGKDTVANMLARTFPVTNSFKFTPLTKKGDTNLVYYTGFYTQNVEPNAKYKKGGIDAGSYTMIASKDSQNDWKISYFHSASAPFQVNK